MIALQLKHRVQYYSFSANARISASFALEPFSSLAAVDFTMQLFAMNDSIPTYLIPMHISLNGNAVSFAYDAPEYDPDWAERHAPAAE